MDYLTIKEASGLWQMDISTIGKLLRAGRISGAAKIGDHWFIPKNTPRPADGRTKQAKTETSEDFFRFPLYVNFDSGTCVPPLSREELLLQRAQKAFFACDFDSPAKIFRDLAENAQSIHIKLCALFFCCVNALCTGDGKQTLASLQNMSKLMTAEFPHKKEMQLLRPWLDSFFAFFRSASDNLHIDPTYSYDASVYPLAIFLSVYHMTQESVSLSDSRLLDVYEVECRQFEHRGFFYEAQELHMSLFLAYVSLKNRELTSYHLKKALNLAKEHNLYFSISAYESYYPGEFDKVLAEYPDDFVQRIRAASQYIFQNFSDIASKNRISSLYNTIASKDMSLAIYAFCGYSNKDMAELMQVSERTVATHYQEIYKKLNFGSKRELADLIGLSLTEK